MSDLPGDDHRDSGREHDAAETAEEADGFSIRSDAAFVAATTITCSECEQAFEAICVHCRRGSVLGEPLRDFTLCHIQAMEFALVGQLARWPNFSPEGSDPADPGDFVNHCPGCGAPTTMPCCTMSLKLLSSTFRQPHPRRCVYLRFRASFA